MPTDTRRFALIPLPYSLIDSAVVGEIVTDAATGDIYIIKPDGSRICATKDLDIRIQNIINSGITNYSYMYLNNRRVYKFYYDNEVVRLDQELTENLPSGCAYFKIRDLYINDKYFVPNLMNIHNTTVSSFPFVNNETYIVEFFNTSFELITQINFTAKYAPAVLQSGDPLRVVNRIEIHTNRDFLYQGENIDALLVNVFVVYEDGSTQNVTNSNLCSINIPLTDTDTLGSYEITAQYFYDTVNGLYEEGSKVIEVVTDTYANIIDLIVVPRKIVNLNDGRRSILLDIIAYYADSTIRKVSDDCIVTGFNPILFNTVQHINVGLNLGHTNTIDRNYDIRVDDDGSASDNKLYFKDNIMSIDPNYNIPAGATKYRVRAADDINFWFSPVRSNVGYDTLFWDRPEIQNKVHTGFNLIIEFYATDDTFVDAVVFTCEYNPNI